MNIQDIIAKKRDKQKLNKAENRIFIKEYTNWQYSRLSGICINYGYIYKWNG